MQAIAPVTNADLLAKGQRPQMRLEVFVPAVGWVNICALGIPPRNYLKDISFSSGGARLMPEPIAGQFSAIINNEGNIFHPNHPTSPYATYFQAGVQVRISLGGTYTIGGVRLWQRIIGYMDEPEFASSDFEFTIKGLDYMKVLSDMKFTKEVSAYPFTPIDNMWGTLLTTNSLATTGYGAEEYGPGGDAAEIPPNEVNGVGTWTVVVGGATTQVNSQAQIGGFSAWELEFVANPAAGNFSRLQYNAGVGCFNAVAGQEYYVTFEYTRTGGAQGDGRLRFGLYDLANNPVGGIGPLDPPVNNVWHTASFSFTYAAGGWLDIWIWARVLGATRTWRIDNISIRSVTGVSIVYYNMPAACTGIYYVELDGEAQWPGKQKGEGWYYDSSTNRFYFDEDKVVAAGVNNLDIWYYTAQNAEDVVADILAKAGFYANRAAALAAMGAPATGVSISRVWFNAGSAYLKAIRMICERCNWRFYFDGNGNPVFVTAPTAGAPVFTTFLPQHFTSPRLYQNRNEIWNRIVIEGEKAGELTGWEDNMPSELKDEAFDAASIAAYGERTKSIKNYLFQDLASITAMCATRLAADKDPKWYLDFDTPYNAVPLELGDTVLVRELLDITLPPALRHVTHTCLIRNADISRFNVTYKCQI